MLDAREIYSKSGLSTLRRDSSLTNYRKVRNLSFSPLMVRQQLLYKMHARELELARSAAMIRQGMAEQKAGKDRDAREALEKLRSKYGIPR